MFLFVIINERICKVLSERTRCSFGSALYKSRGIKVTHGRIPGDYPQTIADLLH